MIFVACFSVFCQLPICTGSTCPIPDAPLVLKQPPLPIYFDAYHVSGDGRVCPPGSNCCGCFTELGFLTAGHCPRTRSGFSFRGLDTRIFTEQNLDALKVHRFGSGDPSWFYDRRGNVVRLTLSGSNSRSFFTDQFFYSGESGSPVFNRVGRIVGVVSGNVVDPGSESGIVARTEVLLRSASSQALRLTPQTRGRRALRFAARSIVEREFGE